MKKFMQRRLVWLALLMVWVGMVISISNYRGTEEAYEAVVEEINVKAEEQMPQDVSSITVSHSGEKDFFAAFRLEREEARAETLEILEDLIENPNTDEGIKQQAQEKILALTGRMEKEKEIENLIRARGYQESLAFLHDDTVDIIIQTEGLERDDVARVGDIVSKATGFNFADITIIEKKIPIE